MLRPGSAIKRKSKAPPAAIALKKQDENKLPDASHFLKLRDFTAALCLLDCDRKYAQRHDLKTFMGIAYCAFHNGDYKRAMEIYDDLLKRPGYDQNLHVYKACCFYALG